MKHSAHKASLKTAAFLTLPVVLLLVVGLVLQNTKPAFEVRKTEVLPLSAAEKREYQGADLKVVVEIQYNPSIIKRPFSRAMMEGAKFNGLIDASGRKYTWTPMLTSYGRRAENYLVTYPVALHVVPAAAGRVTFTSRFGIGNEWRDIPVSAIVRKS